MYPRAYEEALRGNLGALRSLMGASSSERPAERGWLLAARALMALGPCPPANRPSVTEVDDLLVPSTASAGASEALCQLARIALLNLDGATFRQCLDRLDRLRADPVTGMRLQLLRLHQKAMQNDGKAALDEGPSLSAAASKAGAAALVVDVTTVQALGALTLGDLTTALSLARRAARMAQAEHLWPSHYLAALVLARVRRSCGNAHLAHRISTACLQVAGPAWRGWLLWERTWAGGFAEEENPRNEPASRLSTAASAVYEWILEAPYDGDDGEVRRRAVCNLLDGWALPIGDVAAAACVVLPSYESSSTPEVSSFASGETQTIPGVLSGLVVSRNRDEPGGMGPVVLVAPNSHTRRVLGFAKPRELPLLTPAGSKSTRVDAILAAVALAGAEGIGREALFERVYGFPFRKHLHEPTFKVLRHNAKDRVAEFATLERVDGRYRLQARRPFAIADPRCQRPLQDMMLRCMAQGDGTTAKSLASQLSVPLRTVQTALRSLVEDGSCSVRRDGRSVHYEVEDTTFTEVTVA